MPKKRADGEGSIRKRADGRWETRYTDTREIDPGKRVKSIIGKTQKVVVEKLKVVFAEISEGTPLLSNENPTVAEWLDLWMNEYAINNLRDGPLSGDVANGSYTASKEVSFTFAVVGGSAKQAYKGVNRNAKNQDYIFIGEGETAPIQKSLLMATADIWEFEEVIGTGGLKILKYNQKTNTLEIVKKPK